MSRASSKKGLTLIQRKFIKEMVTLLARGEKTYVPKKAALAAGYAELSAEASGYANLRNPMVMTEFLEELRKRKMTSDVPVAVEESDVTEMYIIKGVRLLAETSKSDAVRLEAFKRLGSWWRIGMWDEKKVLVVDPIADKERLIGRINELLTGLGHPQLTGVAAGIALLPGGDGAAQVEERDRRGEVDTDTSGVSIGQLRNQVIQRGNGVGEDGGNGDGCVSSDDGGASVAGDGGIGEAADIREGDGTVVDGQRGQGTETGVPEVAEGGLH